MPPERRSGCGRHFCPHCGEEMIHRDNRRGYESASAIGQIIHRQGPVQLTVGDIDLYVIKLLGNRVCLRIIEHKQPAQALKPMQRRVLLLLDQCIRHVAGLGLLGLTEDSGVFVMRGDVAGGEEGSRRTDFRGPQTVETVEGQPVVVLGSYRELGDWLCCGTPWQPRNERW